MHQTTHLEHRGRQRAVDRHARATPGFVDRLASTIEQLRRASDEHTARIVQASSLAVEDMVLTDLIAQQALPMAVATLDTGMLHPQTLAMLPRIRSRYGIDVAVFKPQAQAVVEFVEREGNDVMRRSVALRKACCGLRKLEPLSRMLEGRTAWVTGLRRDQSEARADVAAQQRDGDGRVKFNPLADWSWADVWQYVALNDVPYNPLHDDFYPSIGCEPCTRAITLGEPLRAGRWWWEDEAAKECGLHAPPSSLHPQPSPKATA
jgi:phosphoadenosine phosphosulfate reductase